MKGFLLTLAAFAAIFGILNAGYYKDWFESKPEQYWTQFLKEKDDTLDYVGIMKERYGVGYTICLKVKEAVEKKHLAHPIILFEPNSFYRDSLHIYSQIHAPEPAVFYYYTGLEGVWTNSPNVSKANLFLRISKKGVNLDEIHTPEQLQRILDFYKKYPPTL
jgi:hypothetical protein